MATSTEPTTAQAPEASTATAVRQRRAGWRAVAR